MTVKKTEKTPKKVKAPILGKYFNSDFVISVVYRNGGIAPGGSGNVMEPEFFGCGVTQEEFHLLLTFYGGMMLLSAKDPKESEEIYEEIGRNLLEFYKLDEEEKKWVKTYFIDKKKK